MLASVDAMEMASAINRHLAPCARSGLEEKSRENASRYSVHPMSCMLLNIALFNLASKSADTRAAAFRLLLQKYHFNFATPIRPFSADVTLPRSAKVDKSPALLRGMSAFGAAVAPGPSTSVVNRMAMSATSRTPTSSSALFGCPSTQARL